MSRVQIYIQIRKLFGGIRRTIHATAWAVTDAIQLSGVGAGTAIHHYTVWTVTGAAPPDTRLFINCFVVAFEHGKFLFFMCFVFPQTTSIGGVAMQTIYKRA